MSPTAKKRIWDLLRILLCVAALAIVLRGVKWEDRLWRAAESAPLIGQVVDDEAGSQYRVTVPAGEEVVVPYDQVAVDEAGVHRVAYGLRSVWRRSHRHLFLLAGALFLPVGLLQGFRLRVLLRASDISLSLFECIKLSFAGNFLNFAAPLGSNAGDVFKAYFVALHTERKTEGATTVFLDRVIGLATLLLVVAGLTVFASSQGKLAMLRPYLLTMLGVGLVGALLYLSPVVRQRFVPYRLLERLPGIEHARRVDRTARGLVRRPGALSAAIAYTLALQILAMSAYFTVALAVAMRASLSDLPECYAYFATGAVVQALPGPPQGLGTVELAYRYLFAAYGSVAQIVCLALGIRLMTLLCALPGVLVLLTGAYKPSAAAAAAASESAGLDADPPSDAEQAAS